MTRSVKAVLAILFWLTIGLQFDLSFHFNSANGLGLRDILLQFVSFFTNDTALLIAIVLTLGVIDTSQIRTWNRPSILSALAAFIVIVATVYAILLQGNWSPHGWQLIADRMLHVVLPVLYVLWWLVFVPKGALRWTDALWWQAYPAAYTLYIMVRGNITGRYPYPFLNVTRIGSFEVIVNSAGLLIALVGVGWIFVLLDRKIQVQNGGADRGDRSSGAAVNEISR